MVVVVGQVTINTPWNPETTYEQLREWTSRAFPTNIGLPGSDAIRLPYHSTMLYYGRGVPDEKFLAVIEPLHIERFDFSGVVSRLKAVGNDNRGLIIMIFKSEEMQLAANRLHSVLTRDMDKPPKQELREDDQDCRYGFCPHITLAAFKSLREAENALEGMDAESSAEWNNRFLLKVVRMHNYEVIE